MTPECLKAPGHYDGLPLLPEHKRHVHKIFLYWWISGYTFERKDVP